MGGGVNESVKVLSVAALASAFTVFELRALQVFGIASLSHRTGIITREILKRNFHTLYRLIIDLVIPSANVTYPKYIFPVFLAIIYLILVHAMLKKRSQFLNYLYVIAIILLTQASVFAPHLLSTAIGLFPRSIMSFWTILSLPILFMELWGSVKLKKIILFFMALIICVNISRAALIEANVLANNRVDREFSYMMQSRINEYENQTGIKIKRIIYGRDDSATWVNRTIDNINHEFVIRAYPVDWGPVITLMGYFFDRPYQKRRMTSEEFERIFARPFRRRNWDVLDLDEQLVFIGEECYFVAY